MATDIENIRLGLLQASDWSQLPDVPLTTEQKQAWAEYRQELRDASNQEGWPYTWTPPAPPVFDEVIADEPVVEPVAEQPAEIADEPE
jgi:hypothetical protein